MSAMIRGFCYNGTMNNLIKSKLELLPTSPGCYIHKDKNGTIIYVGKAKNLQSQIPGLLSWYRDCHESTTSRDCADFLPFRHR